MPAERPTPTSFNPYRVWLGIPLEELPADHYRLLGIPRFETDADVIESAADRQMAHVQRHKVGAHSAVSQRLLNELSVARVVLLNPARKAAYDQALQARRAANVKPAPSAPPETVVPAAQVVADPPNVQPQVAGPNPAPRVAANAYSYVREPAPSSATATARKGNSARKGGSARKRAAQSLWGNMKTALVAFLLFALGAGGWSVWRAMSSKDGAASMVATVPKSAPAEDASTNSPAPAEPVTPTPAPKEVETAAIDRAVATPAESAPSSSAPDPPPGQAENPSGLSEKAPVSAGLPPAPVDADPFGYRVADGNQKARYSMNLSGKSVPPNSPWKFEGKTMICVPRGGEHARLNFPMVPPREYVLTAVVERKDASAEIDFGLASGPTRFALVVDGWGGVTSVQQIDGESGQMNEAAHRGVVATLGSEHEIAIVVRRRGVALYCDGQRRFLWQGDLQRLGTAGGMKPDGPLDTSEAKTLFLGGNGGSYTLRNMHMASVSDEPVQFLKPTPSQPASAAPVANSSAPADADGNPVAKTQPTAMQPPATALSPRAPLGQPTGNEPNRPLRVLQERGEHYAYIGLSPDAHWAAWGTYPGVHSLADLRKNIMAEPPLKLQQNGKAWFLLDGIHMLVESSNTIYLFNLETHELRETGRLPSTGINVFSRDGLAYASVDNANHAVSIVAPANGNLLYRAEGFPGDCFRVEFSPRGRFLLTTGYRLETRDGTTKIVDSFCKLFDVKSRREVPCDSRVAKDSNVTVSLTDDGKMAVKLLQSSREILIYDIASNALLKTIEVKSEGTDHVNSLALTPDGRRVLAGCMSGSIKVFNVATGELESTLVGHHGYVMMISIAADGRAAISSDSTGGVLLWRLAEARRFLARKATASSVPSADDQKLVIKTVREAFADDFAKAKKPAEKSALADKLLAAADDARVAAEKYVLASQARDLARAAADPNTFLRACETLYQAFDIDLVELITADADAISKSASLSNPAREQLAEGLLEVVDRLVAEDDYDAANRLLVIAAATARKIKNPPLNKTMGTRQAEVKELAAHAGEIKAAEETLRNNSDDPAANLALGKFHCLSKNDWSVGLPLLAKSGDTALEQAANQEIAAPKSATDQSQLADAWYAIAESANKRDKAKYYAHAATWYRSALPGLDGLANVKAKKRLAELEEK